MVIISIFVLLFSIEVYNTYNISLKNMTKNYKETFQYLGNKLENVKFIGGYSLGFTLYSSNTAYINFFSYGSKGNRFNDQLLIEKTKKLAIESKEIDYMIAYELDNVEIWNPQFKKLEVIMPVEKTVYNGIIANRNVVLYIEKENCEDDLE